jgi:hypothetical protein
MWMGGLLFPADDIFAKLKCLISVTLFIHSILQLWILVYTPSDLKRNIKKSYEVFRQAI